MLKKILCSTLVLTMSLPSLSIRLIADETKADGFHSFESEAYYESHASEFQTDDWFNDFVLKKLKLNTDQLNQLNGLHYYLRIDPTAKVYNFNEIDNRNPENVNRVIKLMPRAQFDAMFPNSTKGPCSYEHFLQAVAYLPGLFSDYDDFSTQTSLNKTDEMKNPDLVAEKILSAIMANAVQETSTSGQGNFPTLEQKVPGTFATLKENPTDTYNSISMGPFAPNQPWESVAAGNLYYGRGVHQITYGMTYANISLFLYGDLRLMKYPDLLATDTVLPWITTLVYFVLPQSQYPTIAEIFDGQWKKHIEGVTGDKEWKARYLNEFPMCVLLINGGIECGQSSLKTDLETQMANNNTKIRGDAYYHFAGIIPVNNKLLLNEKNAEVVKDVLDGKQVLDICHTISQNDPAGSGSKGLYQGLRWYRFFFITKDLVPANYATDYMVFGGKNIQMLFNPPEGIITSNPTGGENSNTTQTDNSSTEVKDSGEQESNQESSNKEPVEFNGSISCDKGQIILYNGVYYKALYDLRNVDVAPVKNQTWGNYQTIGTKLQ